MTASNMTVGYVTGGEGTVTIDGAGTQLQLSAALKVGNSGDGGLTVSDGATVTADYAMLGVNATGYGGAVITGAGSSVTLTNQMHLPRFGDGRFGGSRYHFLHHAFLECNYGTSPVMPFERAVAEWRSGAS